MYQDVNQAQLINNMLLNQVNNIGQMNQMPLNNTNMNPMQINNPLAQIQNNSPLLWVVTQI